MHRGNDWVYSKKIIIRSLPEAMQKLLETHERVKEFVEQKGAKLTFRLVTLQFFFLFALCIAVIA